jgi:hypothetical protein
VRYRLCVSRHRRIAALGRLVGSALHPAGLSHVRKRLPSEVEFVQMDARDAPTVGVFDLTGAFDVIEHIADDEAVLRGGSRIAVARAV